MPAIDHYRILGLDRHATQEEIKARYRQLVRELHPDVSCSPETTARFVQVTESYRVLSDPVRRSNFDAILDIESRRSGNKAGTAPSSGERRQASSEQAPKAGPSPTSASREVRERLDAAHIHFATGRLRLAEQEAKTLIGRYPRLAPAYALLGDVYRTQQKWDVAARMYSLAIQYAPHDRSFERRYQQVLDKLEEIRLAKQGPLARSIRNRNVALGVSLIVQPVLMGFVCVSNDAPLALLPMILHWTPSLLLMMFVSGAITGVLLSASEQLDRWESLGSLGGRFSRAGVYGVVAAIQFWVALVAYGVSALLQEAGSPSLTRLFGWTTILTACFAVAFSLPQPHGWAEVAIWGGNVLFLGALAGWRVMDAFKG
ncbi:MAG: J domain-containing protein [Fimbriimonadia bacterium]